MHRPHLHDGYVPSAWRICIARMTDMYHLHGGYVSPAWRICTICIADMYRLYDGMYRLHETP